MDEYGDRDPYQQSDDEDAAHYVLSDESDCYVSHDNHMTGEKE